MIPHGSTEICADRWTAQASSAVFPLISLLFCPRTEHASRQIWFVPSSTWSVHGSEWNPEKIDVLLILQEEQARRRARTRGTWAFPAATMILKPKAAIPRRSVRALGITFRVCPSTIALTIRVSQYLLTCVPNEAAPQNSAASTRITAIGQA